MFESIYKLMFPRMMFSFAEGDGLPGGDNGGDKDKDTVSKEDFEAATARSEQLEKELEDMRMEIISPEYLEFLNSKSTKKDGDDGGSKPLKTPDIDEDKLAKMSPKELLALAKDQAKAELRGELDEIKQSMTQQSESATQREIAAFARKTPDFEKFRPIMYGLSLDPKHKELTLQELYDKAKDHVKGLHTDVPDEEKERQKRLSGEKPDFSSLSFDDSKKLSSEEAAKKAADFVEENLGPIPSA